MNKHFNEEEMTGYDIFKLRQNEARQKLFGRNAAQTDDGTAERIKPERGQLLKNADLSKKSIFGSEYEEKFLQKNKDAEARKKREAYADEYTYKDYLLSRLERPNPDKLMSEEEFNEFSSAPASDGDGFGMPGRGAFSQKRGASLNVPGKKISGYKEDAANGDEDSFYEIRQSRYASRACAEAVYPEKNGVSEHKGTAFGNKILKKLFGDAEIRKGGKIFIAFYVIIVLIIALTLIVTTASALPSKSEKNGANASASTGTRSSDGVKPMTVEEEEGESNWFDRLCDSLNK